MKAYEINNFINENVKYKDWQFLVVDNTSTGGGIYLQVLFEAPDNYDLSGPTAVQKSRKWQLSEWMTPTEIVQTCYAAVIRAETHEVAELFRYRGQRHLQSSYQC